MPSQVVANPAGVNGPRPQRTTGRQREVLTNIASKQNPYPTAVIHRPGAPGAPGTGPKPGAAGAGPSPAATPFKVENPDTATPSAPKPTASTNPMASLLAAQKQTLASLQSFDLVAALARGKSGGPGQQAASTAVGSRVVKVAERQIGDPYVWGAEGANAFDCSGLVYFSLNRAGVKVPRTTAQGYMQMSSPVSRGNLQAGDLLFYHYGGPKGYADHVGIYIGGGRMVVAPHAGADVQIQAVDWANLLRGGRIR